MKTLSVKPAEGRLVRDPETYEPIPAEGAKVPRTPYWIRRLADGDVIETKGTGSRRSSSKKDS